MVFTYLKFLIPRLLCDAFSDSIPFTVSSKSDASHDYKGKQAVNYLIISTS
jgi:hypothetical protein